MVFFKKLDPSLRWGDDVVLGGCRVQNVIPAQAGIQFDYVGV